MPALESPSPGVLHNVTSRISLEGRRKWKCSRHNEASSSKNTKFVLIHFVLVALSKMRGTSSFCILSWFKSSLGNLWASSRL